MTATTSPRSEDETRALARESAAKMVAKLREENAAYTERSGEPSLVSELDYLTAEDEIETAMLRVAGLKPRKAGHV